MAKKAKSQSGSSASSKNRAKKVGKVSKKAVRKSTATRKTAKETATRKAAAGEARKAAAESAKKKTTRRKRRGLRKAQLEKFCQMLLEKRHALVGDMSGIQAETTGNGYNSSDLSNVPTHPADVGTDNYEHEFSLGLLESEQALLSEIDEALERINNGTYGICAGTGEMIGLARLQARPWAKYCIEYAHKIEQGLVRPDEEDRPFGE